MDKYIKAAILEKIKKPLKLSNIQIPKINYGQVLVKVFFSGICRSQIMEIKGLRGKDNWLPHLLGHEGSGEVIKIGKGVKKVKVGDKIILTWIKSKGLESKKIFFTNDRGKKVNAGKITTFSNYTIASENRVIKKPKSMSLISAALFGCAIPTGAGIVLKQLKPKKKDIVIVIGLGGVGLSSIMALKALGVKKIIALDINNKKLLLAKKIGATHLFKSSDKDIKKKIFSLTNNFGADFCIDSAGLTSTIELGFSLINKTGKLIFASHPPDKDYINLKPHELIKGKRIEGSWGGQIIPDKDIKKIFYLFEKKNIKYNLIASKPYLLKNINKAIKDLETGRVFRPIIRMQH